ncbi:hypothetical protein [Streptomyces sp. Ru73]|uniref:hypothetical protein n=1 Tax=Streptomyces sp. Ru73 TaxID=2080748 RepID=UPI0011B02927|nr:hypothetical protein [Streptomyces sp. Ru73]
MARTDEPDRPVQETASAAAPTTRHGTQRGAHVAQEKGQEVASTVREGAADVLDETTTQGRNLYATAKEQVSGETGAQVQRMAVGLRRIADDLRHMSDEAKPDSPAASLVRQAADRGHALADRLDRGRPGELMDDVKDFARRRPGLFLAGAALAGFAVSRMGKGMSATGSSPSRGTTAPAGERSEQAPAAGHGPLETRPETGYGPEGTMPAPERSGSPPEMPGPPPQMPQPAPPVPPPPRQQQSPPRQARRPGQGW